jgi:acetyl esterase/lipase
MGQDDRQNPSDQQTLSPLELTRRRVVYDLPGASEVVVQRDLEFRAADGGPLPFDLYLPASRPGGPPAPVVVVVAGYPDTGTRLPCKFKEMGWATSWGRLIAASGVAAITYSNRTPAEDLDALLMHLGQHAGPLGIDAGRMALWAASGNVPLALSVLMQANRDFRCAVLCCGFMLDLDGATSVADAAATYGFVNPGAGRSLTALPAGLPLFVARAGRDQFEHLNESLDRFLTEALACNLPVSFVNHATGPHAFDLFDDSDSSREIIRGILSFLQFHLRPIVAAVSTVPGNSHAKPLS